MTALLAVGTKVRINSTRGCVYLRAGQIGRIIERKDYQHPMPYLVQVGTVKQWCYDDQVDEVTEAK